jgi:hypothetical protein
MRFNVEAANDQSLEDWRPQKQKLINVKSIALSMDVSKNWNRKLMFVCFEERQGKLITCERIKYTAW